MSDIIPEEIGVLTSLAREGSRHETKRIRLNVCQGVGDIFWVYQKFAPYFDKIDFCILHLDGGHAKIQTRSVPFLHLLPKTCEVLSKVVPGEEYTAVAQGHFPMGEILKRYEEHVASGQTEVFTCDYACNKPLEEGIRIEDIDPGYLVEDTVAIQCTECPLAFDPGTYTTLYVSGGTNDPIAVLMNQIWLTEHWRTFLVGFYKKHQISHPIIQIGASYDHAVLMDMEAKLKKAGFRVHTYIDSWAANVTYILKNSVCFFGYQSGLNILADNLDTKQVMMYFPMLEKMKYAWCKQRNIKTKFHADLFSTPPRQVLKKLALEL
jgi:hypothetical protein